MPFGKFTLYTFLGCVPWSFALTWAGVLLGNNWETFIRYGRPISYIIAAVSLAIIGRWVWKRLRSPAAAETARGSAGELENDSPHAGRSLK
jgi:membrane protein DedA with SNARE-associated domain